MQRKDFRLIFLLLLFATASIVRAQGIKSIRECGVLPENTPAVNRANLQKAIDEASRMGGALLVEPAEGGYPVESGIILRRNVSLIGVHGPTGRGTASIDRKKPVGSLFVITDTLNAFITVESATRISGIQFWYPRQTHQQAARIIAYPPTIKMSSESSVQGVTLSSLTFYGEYMAMDFRPKKGLICEQILFEHCYGYPLSGRFIAIDRCYDIPRILHCHVNPANMREFGRSYSKDIIDAVVAQKSFTYTIDHTDNAQLMDLFTFGVYGGIWLGRETYGQLTNFNLDCVCVGIYKDGGNVRNRNWMISQGSIIANTGPRIEDVHPFLVDGMGHLSITNVEAFSGDNGALSNLKSSYDFLTIRGNQPLSIILTGCRMMNYQAPKAINNHNPKATILVNNCIDRNGPFQKP